MARIKRKLFGILIAAPLLLGGKGCEPQLVGVACIKLEQYSQEFLLQLADETDELIASGDYPAVVKVIGDNRKTRDAIRECIAAKARAKK